MLDEHALGIEKKDFSSGFVLCYQLTTCPEVFDLNRILSMAYYSSYWTEAGLALAPDKQSVFLIHYFNSSMELNRENNSHARFMAGVGVWKDVISGFLEVKNIETSYNFIDEPNFEDNIRRKILKLI